LSHLFNQGTNAIELLKLESQAVENLKKLIEGLAAKGASGAFITPLGDEKYHIIFGIVTHKDKSKKSGNLPLFSRISLMRNMRALQLMSVRANFGFIEDESRKSVGKKKQRKKKAQAAENSKEVQYA